MVDADVLPIVESAPAQPLTPVRGEQTHRGTLLEFLFLALQTPVALRCACRTSTDHDKTAQRMRRDCDFHVAHY